MSEDEVYLRALGVPEFAWVLSDQQLYTAVELAEHMAMSDEAVRKLAASGAFPGAILHPNNRIGWRIPRSGVLNYLAVVSRATQNRQKGVS